MNLDEPKARAALGLLAALILAALVLRWGFRTPGRPPGYRPRHRRPRWPRRRHKTTAEVTPVEHEGATVEWSPTADLEAAATATTVEVPTIAEVSADAAVIVEHQHRAEEAEEAAILAEVRAEMADAWARVEDAVIKDRMRTAATLARWERAPQPTYDRSAARDEWQAALFEEVTVAIPVERLRELVGAR